MDLRHLKQADIKNKRIRLNVNDDEQHCDKVTKITNAG